MLTIIQKRKIKKLFAKYYNELLTVPAETTPEEEPEVKLSEIDLFESENYKGTWFAQILHKHRPGTLYIMEYSPTLDSASIDTFELTRSDSILQGKLDIHA